MSVNMFVFRRTLKTLWSYLHERRVNTVALWAEIKDMVIKTILRSVSVSYNNEVIVKSIY